MGGRAVDEVRVWGASHFSERGGGYHVTTGWAEPTSFHSCQSACRLLAATRCTRATLLPPAALQVQADAPSRPSRGLAGIGSRVTAAGNENVCIQRASCRRGAG